jgi:MFS family permease
VRLPARLAVLEERNFRLLFFGQSVSLLGDYMVPVALAFAVLSLTGSPSDLGLVLLARTAPLVAFLLVGGVVADRLSRRRVMLTADLIRCASEGVMAGLLLTRTATLWELAVMQAVHGTASAFFQPASTGVLPLAVTRDRLQQANALRGLSMSAGTILGPAASGALVAGIGSGWAIAADAASFAVSAGFLVRMALPDQPAGRAQSFLADLRDGWGEFVGRTWVWTIVLVASLMNMFFAGFAVLGPVVAKHQLGGAGAWGLISAGLGLGSLLGGVLILRHQPARPLRTGCWCLALFGLPLFALAPPLPALAVAATTIVASAGLMVFNGLWETALQQHVPSRALSRVSAYDWFGSLACQPIGYAIVGPLAASIGVHVTLWLSGGLMVCSVIPLLMIPSIRGLGRAPEVATALAPAE